MPEMRPTAVAEWSAVDTVLRRSPIHVLSNHQQSKRISYVKGYVQWNK